METDLIFVEDLAITAYFKDCFNRSNELSEKEFVAYLKELGHRQLTWIQFFDLFVEYNSVQQILHS